MFVAKTGCGVYAFEPSPNAFNSLRENTNSYPNIIIHPCALDKENGESNLYLHEISGHDSLLNKGDDFIGESVKVKTRSLDSFEFENVGVIKIDSEGSEIPILLGSKETIKKNKPRLIIEVHISFEEQMEKITKILNDLDYRWIVKHS